MVLMVDNYDSFTYNIVQYILELGEEVRVIRNDELSLEDALNIDFDKLIISPGPGRPENTGISMGLIEALKGKKPILGVCLGHQTIAQFFGGKIISAKKIMHGKSDFVNHNGKTIFHNVTNPLKVIRYHSLVVDSSFVPDCLEITATSSDGEIMAFRHKKYSIEGVQFHPESIGSEDGYLIFENFLKGENGVLKVQSLLKKRVSGEFFTASEAEEFMNGIINFDVTPAQIGSFLTALAITGTNTEELTGLVKYLYDKAEKLPLPEHIDLLDTCGTGGDGFSTFNISTASAFLASAAGVMVAKHGNRSITSKSGSADVLEALGVKIDLSPLQASDAIEKVGMAFLFAPGYHPAFKNIMGPRKELAFRTIFNIMGPLLNPAKVKYQVMGIFSEEYMGIVAEVLRNIGVKRALVVHGCDGMDEFTLTDCTKVTELKDGWIKNWIFDPRDYGFALCKHTDLKGGSADENARIIKGVLSGKIKGPARDIVVINSAAAIYTYGLTPNIEKAIIVAQNVIDDGNALKVLDGLIEYGKDF